REIDLGPMRWYSFKQTVTINAIERKIFTMDIADIAAAPRIWAGLGPQFRPDIVDVNVSDFRVNEMTSPGVTIAVDCERSQSGVTRPAQARPELRIPAKVG